MSRLLIYRNDIDVKQPRKLEHEVAGASNLSTHPISGIIYATYGRTQPIAEALVVDRLGEEGPRGYATGVQRKAGFALYLAQIGEKHVAAKPLKGFGSAGVMEVVEDYQSDTYRAVYTVRLKRAVYVLHCFKKKSTKGAQTPKPDMDLIRARLKVAEQMDRET